MKTINTLSIFITLCLTIAISLILSSMTVHAAELPKAQLEKVEQVNQAAFAQQAKANIASAMANLQLTKNDDISINTGLISKQVKTNKTNENLKLVSVNTIAE